MTLTRRVAQLAGTVRQLMLFRQLFDPASLLLDSVRFPIDRYLRKGRSSWPTNITLVIRSDCNVRCTMCHSVDIIDSRERAMSPEQLRVFIHNLGTSHRRPSLFLTGGEPFMRRDILEVIELIHSEGMACGVVTNGTLLGPDRIQKLVDLDLECLVLSLHGPPDVHDAITQKPGSYDKLHEAVTGMIRARRRTTVVLNCAITESNVDHLEEVVEVGERLGVDAVRFEHLNFVTSQELSLQEAVWERLGDPNASVNSYTHEISCDIDFPAAVERLRQRRFGVPVFIKPNLRQAEMRHWYSNSGVQERHCVVPWRSLFVSAQGDVYPCLFMFFKVGNLLEQPLSEIWNGEKMVRFRQDVGTKLFPACARCCKL